MPQVQSPIELFVKVNRYPLVEFLSEQAIFGGKCYFFKLK